MGQAGGTATRHDETDAAQSDQFDRREHRSDFMFLPAGVCASG